MADATILSVQLGAIAPLGPKSVPSAFVKSPVAGSVQVEPLGLLGDAQADLTVHGGPEKAVYAYPAAHYPRWAAEFPDHAHQFIAGSVGENLTIAGLAEDTVCVGDVHAIGIARLQVCQPRQPCFKFALRFGNDRLPNAMLRNGRSGWYYRVLQPGLIAAGDAVALVDRPHPAFAFDRLVAIVYRGQATREELAALAAMAEVPEDIRLSARRRLERAG